jgi:hypothetical protein
MRGHAVASVRRTLLANSVVIFVPDKTSWAVKRQTDHLLQEERQEARQERDRLHHAKLSGSKRRCNVYIYSSSKQQLKAVIRVKFEP